MINILILKISISFLIMAGAINIIEQLPIWDKDKKPIDTISVVVLAILPTLISLAISAIVIWFVISISYLIEYWGIILFFWSNT